MTKKTKLITIISSAVLFVALLTLAICLIVANNNREKTETTIISCVSSDTTAIHLVVNGNNKVMKAVPLKDNAKGILLNNNLEGMKSTDAVKLFVTKSVEGGYLDVNTTGYKLSISLGGSKKDYSKLTKEIENSINGYLSDMGIISFASVTKVDSLKDFVTELKPTAQNVDNESEKELMSHYLRIYDLIKDIKPSALASFYSAYDAEQQKHDTKISEANAFITERNTHVNTLNTEIETLNNEIANLADGEEKTAKQNELDAKVAERTRTLQNIEQAQSDIDNADALFNKSVSEIRDTYANNKDTENLALKNKNTADNTNTSAILAEHAEYVSAHRTEIDESIQAFKEKYQA